MNAWLCRSLGAVLAGMLCLALLSVAVQPQRAALLPLIAFNAAVLAALAVKRPARWLGVGLFALTWTAFPLFKIIRPLIPWEADTVLVQVDSLLWGGRILPAYFRFESAPLAANVLAGCYFLFFPQVLGAVMYYGWKQRVDFFNRLLLGYLVGFVGYFALPAAGPALTTLPHGTISGSVAAQVSRIVADGVTGMDVFPSLHTALSVFITAYFWRDGKRRLACALVPVTVGIVLATIYLRYHYGVDVIAGLLLAAGLLMVRLSSQELPCSSPSRTPMP